MAYFERTDLLTIKKNFFYIKITMFFNISRLFLKEKIKKVKNQG